MGWRLLVPLAFALGAVAVALTLPSPRDVSPRDVSPTDDAAPARLADVWSAASTVTLSAALPDGFLYQPLYVVDAATSLGLATSADLNTALLVVRVGDAPARELRVLQGQQRSTVAAATVAGDQLFWVETGEDGDGKRETSVWTADLHGGRARPLVRDSSDIVYFDSAYDLQVADGYLRWAAVAAGAESGGAADAEPVGAAGAESGASEGIEVRSVPVAGGPVSVQRLDQHFALTAWPWVTTSGNSQPGNVELLNLTSGERRTVTGGPDEILNCTPTWCRVTTLINRGQSLTVDVEHPDGRDRRRVGDTSLVPLNNDVALLERFEVLTSVASANAAGLAQRLWLHDLTTDRAILLDETGTASMGSRGSFLWWASGDNETLAWRILDLRQLS